MKILFLNPQVDAQHKLSERLRSEGNALIFASSSEEAWKLIQVHAGSLDLAVLHREGKGGSTPGHELLRQIRSDDEVADLAVILTSSESAADDLADACVPWPSADDVLYTSIKKVVSGISSDSSAVSSMPSILESNEPSLVLDVTPSLELAPPSFELTDPPVLEEAPTSDPPLSFDATSPGFPSETKTEEVVTDHSISEEVISETVPEEISESEAARLDAALPTPSSSDEGGIELSGDTGFVLEVPSRPGIESAAEDSPAPDALAPEVPEQVLESPAQELPAQELSMEGLSSATSILEAKRVEPAESDGLSMSFAQSSFDPSSLAPADSDSKSVAETESSPQSESEPVFEAPPQEAAVPEDEEIASDLPYLFNKSESASPAMQDPLLALGEPIGDAVIPGGASQSPDSETLKRYLLLREQDVAVLSNQLAATREQASVLEKALREEKGRSAELQHCVNESQKRIDEFEREKALALEGLHAELEELKFLNKTKTDKARLLEQQVHETADEIERLKERVRVDIRKIRVREKELENRLEIAKKDSEALIAARESRIIELKRKLDLLEFNMDLLQDQYSREKETSAILRERLAKAAQIVRVVGGVLDTPGKKLENSDNVTDAAEGSAPEKAS